MVECGSCQLGAPACDVSASAALRVLANAVAPGPLTPDEEAALAALVAGGLLPPLRQLVPAAA